LANDYTSLVATRRVPFLAILLGIPVAIAVLIFVSREPSYENRRLSEWLADLGTVSPADLSITGWTMVSATDPGIAGVPERLPRDPERRRRAQELSAKLGHPPFPV